MSKTIKTVLWKDLTIREKIASVIGMIFWMIVLGMGFGLILIILNIN